MKLDIQLFGGRGASSGANTIDGSPIVKSVKGYEYWNINAPKGYIGLIKNAGVGKRGETAYIKSKYAEEVNNLKGEALYAMNSTKKELDTKIKRTETALRKVRELKWQSASDIRARRMRLENKLEQMKRVKELKQKIGF